MRKSLHLVLKKLNKEYAIYASHISYQHIFHDVYLRVLKNVYGIFKKWFCAVTIKKKIHTFLTLRIHAMVLFLSRYFILLIHKYHDV